MRVEKKDAISHFRYLLFHQPYQLILRTFAKSSLLHRVNVLRGEENIINTNKLF